MVRVLIQTWSTWTSAIPLAPPIIIASKGLRNWFWGEAQYPPLFVLIFLLYFILSYFILVYLIFLFRFSIIFKLIIVSSLFFNFFVFFKFFLCLFFAAFVKFYCSGRSKKEPKIFATCANFVGCEISQPAKFRRLRNFANQNFRNSCKNSQPHYSGAYGAISQKKKDKPAPCIFLSFMKKKLISLKKIKIKKINKIKFRTVAKIRNLRKCFPSQFCFDHNLFIRTPFWVILVP